MSAVRRGAIVGAALALGYLAWVEIPVPLSAILEAVLDPVIYLVLAIIGLAGAFVGVSVVLAWRHARESPRWLAATFVGLLLMSVLVVQPFVRETRSTRQFLATADSTKGVVTHKYVRGGIHLVVDYVVAGQPHQTRKVGANPHWGTPAFAEWQRGDSIWVYYQPAVPDVTLVGHPGPEWRALIEALVKVWTIWGVLLTAYLPLIVHRLRRRPAVGGAPLHQYQT